MGLSNLNVRYHLMLPVAAMLALSACTSTPPNAQLDPETSAAEQDPLEGLNRGIYTFNYYVDQGVLRPLAVGYRYIMPEKGRSMVTNFLENLYTPVVFANSVFQLDPQNSFATLWRFLLNTSFGVGGLFDFASEVGLENRPADLGQTFAMYGADTGAYLVLPIIGPSNIRDGFGRLGDAFINPINYVEPSWIPYTVWGVTALDARSNNMKLLDDVYNTSLDPYATFRSLYMQKRESDIKRAKAARAKAQEQALHAN